MYQSQTSSPISFPDKAYADIPLSSYGKAEVRGHEKYEIYSRENLLFRNGRSYDPEIWHAPSLHFCTKSLRVWISSVRFYANEIDLKFSIQYGHQVT